LWEGEQLEGVVKGGCGRENSGRGLWEGEQ
jgi:hypothetical protein